MKAVAFDKKTSEPRTIWPNCPTSRPRGRNKNQNHSVKRLLNTNFGETTQYRIDSFNTPSLDSADVHKQPSERTVVSLEPSVSLASALQSSCEKSCSEKNRMTYLKGEKLKEECPQSRCPGGLKISCLQRRFTILLRFRMNFCMKK